jgi:hypothetical protein
MTTATNLKREIFDLETQYWEASKRGDAKALERLTADNFTFVMGEGIMGFKRPEFVEMMTKEGMKITGYSLDESTARLHEITPEVALLTYKSHIEYEENGKANQGDSYTSSIWARRGGTWQCEAVTDTPVIKH